jgi:PAS domain S-box-containing protein
MSPLRVILGALVTVGGNHAMSISNVAGTAAFELLSELQRDLPFIVVSGARGEEQAGDAICGRAHEDVPRENVDRLTPVLVRRRREQATSGHGVRSVTLRESDRRMRQMIEAATVGIWFAGAEGKTSFMNQRMAQILGLTAEEASHSLVTDFVDAEDLPGHPDRLEQRKKGISASYEHKFRRKNGTLGCGRFESTPLFDAADLFEGVLTVMTDITEQARACEAERGAELDRTVAAAALRASEARFSRLAESGIVGIGVADISGRIHEANDAYLRLLGYSREEIVNVRWDDITPPEWWHSDELALEQLKAHGVATPWEKELFRKDGARIPVLIGVAMLEHPNCLIFIADLAGIKRTEQANVVLEAQLRQSQKMEAVGRLAGGVAHDFNNLLSVVLSYSEMAIADMKEGDPIRDDMEQIRRAGVRAADLTRQLLMFSRQQVIAPKVLDLNDVLTNMDNMLRRLVGEDVEVTFIPGASLGRVQADPGSIDQVVMNLAINARDAMPIGGKLTLETANVVLDEEYAGGHLGAIPGSYVMLSVTDTGAGMDKATQARIFEPFFTTKEKGKGTGLGLSTVFGIVQQSGGSIWVYSERGSGTTFKLYLPRVEAMAEEPRPQKAAATLRGSETILLVEDEDQVRDVARGILRRHGYAVLETRSAGEALLLSERHVGPIHLLLTDVVMPQMSGPELAKRLAKTRPEVKVLCMSGYTDDAAVRHGVLDAAFAYLQKPLTVKGMTRKVREVLDAVVGESRPSFRLPR